MTEETDDRPAYWLPWWWDHPGSVPIQSADFGLPDLSPPDFSPPDLVLPTAAHATPPGGLGGDLGGGPPPAAAAATQLTDGELRVVKRLKKRKQSRR